MEIFAHSFSEDFLLLAPRAPFNTSTSGYGWTEQHHQGFSKASDFSSVTRDLMDNIQELLLFLKQPVLPLHLVGFSQGAALSYYLTATYSVRIGKVACLAGYIPNGIESSIESGLLAGKEFFIAHGTQDETVPVQYAREAVQKLQAGRAKVIYCEDNTGHKLSASCFRGLITFIRTIPDLN